MSTILQTAPSTDLDDFVALSVILTGIAKSQLKPLLDTYNLAQTYLNVARTKAPAQYAALMAVYQPIKTQPPATIGAAIINNADPGVSYMAKSITLLWYLASWYDPAALPSWKNAAPNNFVPSVVVSSDAYTQSWVWRVAQTHPMGYSEWRFGYWHANPPALSSFIGG
jgi:hypothetical protein